MKYCSGQTKQLRKKKCFLLFWMLFNLLALSLHRALCGLALISFKCERKIRVLVSCLSQGAFLVRLE